MVKRILALSLLMVGLAGCGSGDGGGAETLTPGGKNARRGTTDVAPQCWEYSDEDWCSDSHRVVSDTPSETPNVANDEHCPEEYQHFIAEYQTNVYYGNDQTYPEATAANLSQICQDDAYSTCGNATDGTWGITALLNAVRNNDCYLAKQLLDTDRAWWWGKACTKGFIDGVKKSLTQKTNQYMCLKPEGPCGAWTPLSAAKAIKNQCLIDLLTNK